MTNITDSAPLVLIADDLPGVLAGWSRELADYGIKIVSASSLEELNTVFDAHRLQLAAIILDGCIPGHTVTTLPFIQKARGVGFTKPIVASSSLSEYRKVMRRAGASHEAPKGGAVELVADLLSAP